MSKDKTTEIAEKIKTVSAEEFESFKAAVIADLNELARSPQSLNVNKGE